jgi:integrase/recombinase XerD
MLNSHPSPANLTWHLDPGLLRPLVERFTSHLAGLGHSALTVGGYGDAARHFAAWLHLRDQGVVDIDEHTCAGFASHFCRCPGIRRGDRISTKYARRAARFVQFLSECGVAKPLAVTGPAPVNPGVALFQDWLRRHRGIAECTISKHGRMVTRLLGALGADPTRYTAASIRKAIMDEANGTSAAYAKTMTTALRGYLRFLGASGICRAELADAVPTIPQWRLSAMPRYLPANDIERMVAACDIRKANGVRDQAILLLLSRLGLRGGDVLDLRLDDLCWAEGTIRVSGKSRREVCLPLPQDAGDAVLRYICNARPTSDSNAVFLRSSAPYQPFTSSSAISCIVRLALARAGIQDPPSRGANLLRHSAATSMLRAGATLDTIGAVLRHRSATTTAHYAKVDVPMLLQVAQPWPGEAPC